LLCKSADRPYRAQLIRDYLTKVGNKPPSTEPVKSVREATQKAVHFYSMLQASDGHWGGDYGGPHFLLPGLLVVWYCMGKPTTMLSPNDIRLIIPYIMAHQQIDGGWGTHIESPSTMFGTTLMYVALRLLGLNASDPVCVKGRDFIKEQGGAVMTSSWAKFYLCLLGTMHWDGHNSVPPEMWILPNWFPFHPGRMWCHARMVYRTLNSIFLLPVWH
jgi:Squalene-hopene cyclase N-terminal domain